MLLDDDNEQTHSHTYVIVAYNVRAKYSIDWDLRVHIGVHVRDEYFRANLSELLYSEYIYHF